MLDWIIWGGPADRITKDGQATKVAEQYNNVYAKIVPIRQWTWHALLMQFLAKTLGLVIIYTTLVCVY